MRHVELLRRSLAKKLQEDSPEAFQNDSNNSPVVNQVNNDSTKSGEFIVSETAKSIPESLEENIETASLGDTEKSVPNKKKTFPKKK